MPKAFLTRREVLLAGAYVFAKQTPTMAGPARLGDDGLYRLDWYIESFLDLAEDLAGAAAKGKRLAVIWGLKGCPACRRMHEQHLANPEIESYVRNNFDILHLDFIGARDVTDLAGRKRTEKATAEAFGVRFTPTIQFFPETVADATKLSNSSGEVIRMPGLLAPPEFLLMFRYVREKGYEAAPFIDWMKKLQG